MSPSRSRRVFPGRFVLGVVAKGVDGLLDDPHDFIASQLLQAARHLSAGTLSFASVFLLSHGVIKVGLVTWVEYRRLRAQDAFS
jgi:uncharacterized membrane protein